MKTLITTMGIVLLAASLAGAAEDRKATTAPPSPQAERMKACSREAADKQLKGEDRRHFMSECLKGHKPS